MTGRRLVSLLVVLGAALATTPAAATLDPTQASRQVDDAMRENDYRFCREPREPLSSDAKALCGHATEIKDCAGFATACAAPPPPPATPPWWLRWLGLVHLPEILGTIAHVIVWLLVAALVVVVLIPIVRALARMRRGTPEPDRPAGKTSPTPEAAVLADLPQSDEETLLAKAGELARAGDLRGSLQLYLAASLRALDRRGALRITRDRTNGEYVRACGDTAAKPALREIVREVDRVQFGGDTATEDGVRRAAERAVAIVRAVPAALALAVLALALTGCGGMSMPKGLRRGDDPAGGELARDLLAKQGVTVSKLRSSLATLPLPEAGERAPAVVVDGETTSLDDETRDHLVAWVKAGGVLVLAGGPSQWPKELGIAAAYVKAPAKVSARQLLARAVPPTPGESSEEDEDDEESAIYARAFQHGEVVSSLALKLPGDAEQVAWFEDETPYAFWQAYGKGFVVGIATDELLTNAGVARPGNAAVLVAILAAAERTEMKFAGAEDGVSPPSTPVAALLRAGLGLPLGHAAVFVLVLFLAMGTRMARPRPTPPPRRRAFAEHVEAVGALYARAHSAPHALAAYARFADERIRARMPRGSGDVATFLASRAKMPVDVCQRLWARAMQAKAGGVVLGDELTVLRELTALYAAAMAQDR